MITLGVSPASSNLNRRQAYSSVTCSYTTTAADQNVSISGTSGTVTLHTAVGNTGQVLTLIHAGTSLTQVYTLNTTSGQTIGGIASGSYALYTATERLQLVSDGSNWIIQGHDTSTAWVTSGTVTVGATTTAPTKGNSPTTDIVWWRRIGDSSHIRQYLQMSTTTGGSAGSGDYKWVQPLNMQNIDTSKCTVYATVEGSGFWQAAYAVGTGAMGDGTTSDTCVVVPFDATNVRLFGVNPTATGVAASGFNAMNAAAQVFFTLDYIVPILGWQP